MMKEFRQNEEGAITFFVLILSVGLIAMAGLVMDSGRTYSAHSQAQAYMDHIALAMANELDGTSTSMDRARAIGEAAGAYGSAINKSSTLIADKVGDDAVQFQISEIVFLTGQPQTKGSVLRASSYTSLETENPLDATHVLIIGQTASVPWTFLNMTSLVAGLGGETTETAGDVAQSAASGGDFTVSTWSTAELVRDETQTSEVIAICAPSGWDTLVEGQDLVFEKSRNGDWSDGKYGIVTTLPDNAAGECTNYATVNGQFDDNRYLVCAAGISDGVRAPHASTVSFTTDVTDTANNEDQFDLFQGLNTRFGIFEGDAAGLTDIDSVVPDANVQSKDVFQCNGEIDFNVVTNVGGLPTTDCVDSGTCIFGGQMTAEEIEQYMIYTHDENGNQRPTYFGQVPTTRNELYLAEIFAGAAATNPDGNQDPLACWQQTNEEGVVVLDANGNPAYEADAPTPVANRRNIEVAFVDCSQLAQDGSQILATDVPVLGYADLFLTRPVENRNLTVLTFDDYEHPTLKDANGDPVIVTIDSGDVVSTDERFTENATDPADDFAWLWNESNISTQGTADVSSTRYDRTFNPYAPYGIQIDQYRHPDQFDGYGTNNPEAAWKNAPMIYGEVNGADKDLENEGWGNVLMISENGNDDNPNDEGSGGTLVIRFAKDPVTKECPYVETLRVIDTEGGGTIRVYKDLLTDEQIADLPAYDGGAKGRPHYPAPGTSETSVGHDETHYKADDGTVKGFVTSTGEEVPGDEAFLMNAFKAISVERMPHGQDNFATSADIRAEEVCTLLYTMHGDSGGIDDIEFSRDPNPDAADTIYAEFLNYIQEGDGRLLTYPQITN
ncbi:MAG: Tad domain-containing protein [Pseudomonadota bacterium]